MWFSFTISLIFCFDSFRFEKPYFTFGICLPAVCPLNIFEPIINNLLPKNENVSIKLSESTCQLGENSYEFKTLDKVAL